METKELTYDVFAAKCPSRLSFDRIFGKWGMLVLAHLTHGPCRFGEIHRSVDGISERMLSKVLKTLEAENLVLRKDNNQQPPRIEYSLSDAGKKLGESVIELIERLYAALDNS